MGPLYKFQDMDLVPFFLSKLMIIKRPGTVLWSKFKKIMQGPKVWSEEVRSLKIAKIHKNRYSGKVIWTSEEAGELGGRSKRAQGVPENGLAGFKGKLGRPGRLLGWLGRLLCRFESAHGPGSRRVDQGDFLVGLGGHLHGLAGLVDPLVGQGD